jgi:hypothetical protein
MSAEPTRPPPTSSACWSIAGSAVDPVPQGMARPCRALGAAHWRLHTRRGPAPEASLWREARFDTLRLAFVEVAGRVTELATRLELALPSGYPDQDRLMLLSARAAELPPRPPGLRAPPVPVPATPSPANPRRPRHQRARRYPSQSRPERHPGE